jgi:hypothetical protein
MKLEIPFGQKFLVQHKTDGFVSNFPNVSYYLDTDCVEGVIDKPEKCEGKKTFAYVLGVDSGGTNQTT